MKNKILKIILCGTLISNIFWISAAFSQDNKPSGDNKLGGENLAIESSNENKSGEITQKSEALEEKSTKINANKNNSGVRINSIIIEGNKRTETSSVKSYLQLKEGDVFDGEKVNSSIKELYATGLFSDIDISLQKNNLVVNLTENSLVNKIAIENNKAVEKDSIISELSLQERNAFSKAKVLDDIKRIKDIYKKHGFYSVVVDVKVVERNDNRVDVVFEIDEGKKAKVTKINFIGNNEFSSRELKSALNTKEKVWYNFFSSNDNYDPDKLAYDRELLRKFYASKGYADFRILSSSAEITSSLDAFVITFNIEEGSRYKFGKSNISSSIPDVKTENLYKEIIFKEGQVFNADEIEKSVSQITDRLTESGYAFVKIDPEYKKDQEGLIIGLDFKITEGPRVYIDKIDISGNVRTLDKVIRREFRIGEGDPYNSSRIKRSEQRIRNLGYFDKVDFENIKSDVDDKTTIKVKVTEKSTGELSFGAGYSTTDKALGNISIRERNLLGKGQDLRLGFQQSSRGNQIDLSFTEPYFMDRQVAAGIDLFNITRDYENESSYNSSTQGGTLRASYPLTEYLQHSVKYTLSTMRISDVTSDASTYIQQQKGTYGTSLIGHDLAYDKRDNKFDPKSGYYVKLSQDLSGFGGDSAYFKNELNSGYFKPVYKEKVIFSLSAKGGTINGYNGKDVRINERFFIGGYTIRGFKDAGIGPRDKLTSDALGGKKYYAGSAEMTFPLGLPDELGFKGGVFLDAGSLFGSEDKGSNIADESSIRSAAGFGVSWSSPLGPIRIDIAKSLKKEDFDKTETLRLNFGTRF